MSRFENRKKSKRVKDVELNLTAELTNEFSKMSLRCKFNFSYIDVNQDGAASFNDFTEKQLKQTVGKIKGFSEKSIERCKQDKSLKIYGDFPSKSNFKHPSLVPEKVEWACFRLEGDFRLAGFIVPYEITEKFQDLDTNTFYVVFIDPEHKFYPSKKKHT